MSGRPRPNLQWDDLPLVRLPDPTGLMDWQEYAGDPCADDGACQWEYQARMGQYTVVIDSSLYMSEGEFFATIDRVIAQLGDELS